MNVMWHSYSWRDISEGRTPAPRKENIVIEIGYFYIEIQRFRVWNCTSCLSIFTTLYNETKIFMYFFYSHLLNIQGAKWPKEDKQDFVAILSYIGCKRNAPKCHAIASITRKQWRLKR